MSNFKLSSQNKINAEQIKVCIRLRPLLAPYEDEVAWGVDGKDNRIYSLNNALTNGLDPMSFAIGQGGANANMNVMIREKELRRRYQDALQTQQFAFDNVFGVETNTPQIYHVIARPITKAALQGYNGTVFMYGQTTSGKTYTMLGTQEIPGILPCAVRDVFNGIKIDREDNDYNVWVSYMEIYNESINDLLQPGKSNLKLRDDPNHGVDVALLKKQQVWTFDQAIILMNYGEEHRIYKETSIHEHSSRSHTIFRLYIESCPKNKSGPKRYSMLNLVDLAGSERLNEFDNKSDTLGETGYINKSLFILSNVINKLAEGKSAHIPYRDSKLTRILQMALGGNSLTAIICTVSPAAVNYYQTLSTLRFASRAKIVKNKPTVNEIVDEQMLMAQLYQQQVEKLKDELLQRDAIVSQYEQNHMKMQEDLNMEKEENMKLVEEIKLINSQAVESANQHQSYKYKMLKQQVKQERLEKSQLLNELEQLKNTTQMTESCIMGQGSSSNMNSMSVVEKLIQSVERYILDQAGNSTMFRGIQCDKIDLRNNQLWQNETEKIQAEFKIDYLQLQNEYRKRLSQLVNEIFNEQTEAQVSHYINNNILKVVDTEQREKPSQWANAEKVLQDIMDGAVFDDILIEFESVLQRGIMSQGYNLNEIAQGNVVPTQDDIGPIIDDMKEYYGELVQVSQKRYDQVKIILETYFRQQINVKREQLDLKNEELSEEELKQLEEGDQNTFSLIADQHHEKLIRLREGYDYFLKQVDDRFEGGLSQVNQWFNLNIENESQLQQQNNNNCDSNQQYSNGEEDEDQEESCYNVEQSEYNSQQINNIEQQNFAMGYDYPLQLKHNQTNMNNTNKDQWIKKQFNDCSQINNLTQIQKGMPKEQEYYKSNDEQSICSIQEEPPEVRTSIQQHQFITPTPKFSSSNKFRSQQNQLPTTVQSNKENQVIKSSASNLTLNNSFTQSNSSLLPRIKISKSYITASAFNSTNSSATTNTQVFKVFVWGSGKDGRCGNGKENSEKLPNPVASQHKFTQLSCGYHHSAAVSQDGMVLTWGRGIFGQLGHGDTENYSLPTPIESLVKIQIVQVACGWQHTMALSSQGKAFSWGYGEDGQLGHGDTNDYLLPQEISYFREKSIKVAYIACGHSHSACITDQSGSNGGLGPQLYMWGCNPDCRLMIEDNENKALPSLTILEQAKIHQLEKGNQLQAEGFEPCFVSLGVTHSAVITRSGELFTGGSKVDGQLGVKFSKKYTSQLSNTQNSSQQVQENSFLNQYKDQKELKEISSPINRVALFGLNNRAIQVSCGDSFTLVLNEKHQLFSFGKSSHGRLGVGNPNLKDLAQDISGSGNMIGESINEPQQVEAVKNEKVVQISAGCRHSACITENGKLYAWGFNFYEQLGLGDCEKDFDHPTRVSKNLIQHKVKFVSCGYFHTGALVSQAH